MPIGHFGRFKKRVKNKGNVNNVWKPASGKGFKAKNNFA
jgi:hypothetical protein